MKSILIIGNGGHAKVVRDVIEAEGDYKVSGYLDDNIEKMYKEKDLIFDNLRNIQLYQENYYFVIAIGNNKIRNKIFDKINVLSERFPALIHPRAIISKTAEIGNGTVVMPGAIVNAETVIGQHAIINTGSVVEHDCVIKDYTHISPGAVLTGNVSVGESTQVGANATVIPNLKIGAHVMVGAGSTVISDVRDNVTVVGSPAKVIKE
ncbi:acetyltransferase [Staphylococcus simulans]|uniref:acetyltransferase n=1 Tax=Staphylococcus simulans TaxID=1286 RepID=UPI000D1EE1F7|nr:acetyltransferase [Staphylococcus simulans]MDY5059442.1 acetyltransferase [Staphylococcus simulans]PTJ16617.1 acetyltransferase [Staphylococcus simulans]